jgi:hypothetical protein
VLGTKGFVVVVVVVFKWMKMNLDTHIKHIDEVLLCESNRPPKMIFIVGQMEHDLTTGRREGVVAKVSCPIALDLEEAAWSAEEAKLEEEETACLSCHQQASLPFGSKLVVSRSKVKKYALTFSGLPNWLSTEKQQPTLSLFVFVAPNLDTGKQACLSILFFSRGWS